MKRKAAPPATPSDPQARLPEQLGLNTEAETSAIVNEAGLLADLRELIQSARRRIAAVAYSTQTLLCRHMGRRLLTENLQGGRAAYGKQILVTVSRELTAEYGRGFSYAEMCRVERWDVRTLRQRIGSMLFERTALSKRPESVMGYGGQA